MALDARLSRRDDNVLRSVRPCVDMDYMCTFLFFKTNDFNHFINIKTSETALMIGRTLF